MTKGLWISFEGIDGAGKSTHIQGLADAFKSQGREVIQTREPGGTDLAEKLRDLLLHQSMDPLTESLLAFAARRDHLNQVIAPALTKGETVLCDRYTDATFAYQGGGRGVPWETLKTLEALLHEERSTAHCSQAQPDLTIWFDLDPQVAADRLSQARTPDRFESEALDFFTRVRAGYARRKEEDPNRFLIIDASLTKHQVWQQLTRGLVSKGWLSIVTPSSI
jgi:dTMP kinase